MKQMTQRQQRVAETIREEIGKILSRANFDNPLINNLIMVPYVWVSPDLRDCRIYFHSMDKSVDNKELSKALNDERHIFQKGLTKLAMKYTPRIRFCDDDQHQKTQRIEDLLAIHE